MLLIGIVPSLFFFCQLLVPLPSYTKLRVLSDVKLYACHVKDLGYFCWCMCSWIRGGRPYEAKSTARKRVTFQYIYILKLKSHEKWLPARQFKI